jgi:hypothetical protein
MKSDDRGLGLQYVRDPAVLGASLGGEEMALLGAAQGKYYGLNGPATRIWELLEQPRTIGEICEILMGEFDVEPAQCERDTRELIAGLAEERLVVLKQEGV